MNYIVLLGDIYCAADTREAAGRADEAAFFGDVLPLLKGSVLNVANIEAPLADDSCTPVVKAGPNLKNPPQLAQLLYKSNFGLVSLANNHIMDYGASGLRLTCETFRDEGIETFGAGPTEADAAKPVYRTLGDRKTGFMSFAEHEFNKAGAATPGALIFDPYESYERVEAAAAACDDLIVLYHGGVEHHPYPSPLLQKVCRKLIRHGARLVSCQHSHCIGAWETYEGGDICYGQGNSVFGYKKGNEVWNQGILIKITAGSNKLMFEPVPVTAKPEGGITLLTGAEKDRCLQLIEGLTAEIQQEGAVESAWRTFCESKKAWYYPQFFGLGKQLNRINRKLGNRMVDTLFTKRQKMIAHNTIRCQSHREVMETIFENE